MHELAVTFGQAADDVGRSLRESFFMFWETLWPLVLGFGLSGAVQAFVSKRAMRRTLGDHRAGAVLRASGYGMVSSSCSYAAAALAKSLFQRGADFVTAMVFMFASTNLVIELGIVLVILIGWQFAVGEFVGGAIMIVLLVLVGSLALRGRLVADARRRVEEGESQARHEHLHTDATEELSTQPWRARLRSRGAWANAASYAISDLKMLRKEMVIGYVVAGFLAVLVPASVWGSVFAEGHGPWTSVENALVGPFIALISFVCSVGNVPLAAALWQGGISFGGVISFVFADLIALPLLLVYRRFYGGRLALRLLVAFWAVMSAAGLATEALFQAAGLVPTSRAAQIVPSHFSWDYTTYLNIVFLGVFGLLYWAHRNRDRFGAGSRHAADPVCGMRVEKAVAPAKTSSGGSEHYFCSDSCKHRFESDPARFTNKAHENSAS